MIQQFADCSHYYADREGRCPLCRHSDATTSASGVAQGVEVTRDFSCCLSKRIPTREQWKFLGRQTHWRHVFLVWTLIGNPRGQNEIGKRFVRWVK